MVTALEDIVLSYRGMLNIEIDVNFFDINLYIITNIG
jgi:hypothetical protein